MGTRGKSLSIPLSLKMPVVAKRKLLIKIQAQKSFPYKFFIPHEYIAPSLTPFTFKDD